MIDIADLQVKGAEIENKCGKTAVKLWETMILQVLDFAQVQQEVQARIFLNIALHFDSFEWETA